MKAFLLELIHQAADPAQAKNLMREYLQARILASLQQVGAMIPLAFHGGTALRFLFGIRRYSEDLDFALERANEKYDLRAYLNKIRSDLAAETYTIDLKVNDRRNVHSAFVNFPGLLHELGLSAHRDQVFGIKIEVDTKPPEGAQLATTVVRKFEILHLQHHDRTTLLAGILHAILQRPFIKGRDLYDLIWYLSDSSWPGPNLVLLNNALRQTGWLGGELTSENWRGILRQKLENVDWTTARADVRPFLETGREENLLQYEILENILVRD